MAADSSSFWSGDGRRGHPGMEAGGQGSPWSGSASGWHWAVTSPQTLGGCCALKQCRPEGPSTMLGPEAVRPGESKQQQRGRKGKLSHEATG